MFTTSSDFKAGMAEPSRQLTARGLITYPDSDTQALTAAMISKIQITENAGEHLPLGGVSASTLTLSLDNRSGEWNPGGSILGSHSLDGATVKLEVGVYYDSAYQYSNLGIFVLEDVVGQEQETLITLKGADYLANAAGITWADGLTYPKTVIQILTEACSQSGITLKSTTFTNSTQSIATKPVWDENTTCRDVIGYIACLGCGFARINRDGELEIIGFERNAAGDIDDLLNSYFTYTDGVLTFNSDDTILTLGTDGEDLTADPDGLVAGVGNDLVVTAFWDGDRYYVYPSRYKTLTRQGAIFGPFNALSVYEFGAPNGYGATRIADDINIVDNELNSVAVQGNPLLAYELCDTLMANMLTALSGLTFYGGSIAWQGDPTITCGDFVDVYSLNDEAIPLLVLNQTITLDAGFSMSSGNNLNSKVKGKAKTEYMRVFTPTGRLNAAALDGDINIRAGRQLNLLAGADIKVKSGANVDIEAGGKINLSATGDLTVGTDTLADLLTATGSVQTTIWYQDAEPTATATGDIWYDTDASPVTIKRWNGSSWVDITTTALSQALSAAGDAQATADGKIKTFAQNDPPNATAVGDLWVDTNDNNKLYRATAAGNNWALYKIAAGYVATSYITIANDIDIASGGNLNIESGADINVASGGKINVSATDLMISGKTVETYASDKIRLEVSVGGANLLQNSGQFSDTSGWAITDGSGNETISVRSNASLNANVLRLGNLSVDYNLCTPISKSPIISGQTYTLSFVFSGNIPSSASVYDSTTNTAVSPSLTFPTREFVAGSFYLYKATFVATAGSNSIRARVSFPYEDAADYLGWVQLEKGPMATDWSPSPSDPASGVKTSYIDIATDHIDIATGGSVNISAGSDFNVRAGKQNKAIGISNNETNGYMLWAGASTPANAPFSVTMDGSLKATNLDGSFVLGVENGGTGVTVNRTHRGSTVPANSLGQDGDLYVLFNGAVGVTWNDTNLTFGSNTQSTYFGVNRNWNYQQATGYRRIGNGTGSASFDFGTYGSFVCPAATKTLNFKFTTTKYVGGQALSSGVTSYRVALVSSLTGTILATTTVDASTSAIEREVTLTTTNNLTQGTTYYLGIYYPDQTELNGAAVSGNIVLKGSTSSTVGSALYVKTNGAWVRLAYA